MTEAEMTAAVEAANKTADEMKAQAEAIAEDAKKKDEELEKLRSKEFNFKKLRDLTDKEKDKLSDKEKELMARADKLEEISKKTLEEQLGFYKRNAIASVAGNDADMKKAIEAAYDDIKGDPSDQESIEKHVLKATRLVKGEKAAPSAVLSSFAQVGAAPSNKVETKSFSDTDEGKTLANQLGLKTEVKK